MGALWARDRQYIGRDNIKSIPYWSIYRATTVRNTDVEQKEGEDCDEGPDGAEAEVDD